MVEDYIEKGHARKVPLEEMKGKVNGVWYLPHHPVFNVQKPDKLRVVFDCSFRYKGTSLNDQLLSGPDLTNTLLGVLMRFRQERVALMADVKQMFHQVEVHEKDRDVFRFLWWPNGDISQDPEEHQMLVHLFGATSSPSCASFALKRTAEINRQSFSVQAVATVNRNFYVDDCLKSVTSVSEAVSLVNELPLLLEKGGFHLTKWISNSQEVIAAVPESDRASTVVNMNLDKLPVERALGVQWDVERDTFGFKVTSCKPIDTRRKILSFVSSIYDPIGFIAPVVLPAKQFLQMLCKEKFGWDEPIPRELSINWQRWLGQLHEIENVHVSRCLKPKELDELSSIQLHHFSDASSEGYGVASYLRLVDVTGKIHCALLVGKSRVAPLKTITIPRLELTAATLATQLHLFIKQELDLPIHETTFWTDSTIVIQYIRNQSRRFQTFMANRLAQIHEVTTANQWKHVPSEFNPADYASRGLQGNASKEIELWLKGPSFLWNCETKWPIQPADLPELSNDDRELKIKKIRVYSVTKDKEDILYSLITRLSNWYRLQVSMAWLSRYKLYLLHKICSAPQDIVIGPLTVSELRNSVKDIVRLVQNQVFPKEIEYIKSGKAGALGKALRGSGYLSPLRKLNPILVDGILRVGGRIDMAAIGYQARHPIILPRTHHVTELIVRHYHHMEGHLGCNQVLAAVRQKFWILQGAAAIKHVVRKCLNCQRWNARPGQQIMASLPAVRVTPTEMPFAAVGIDYFGPIQVKLKRSVVKRYGCVFTCLVVRAVHIEISYDLSTDSFIQAFTRFVSRRGPPREVYSDNGTNFKGAEADIKLALASWNQSQIENSLRKREIQWHFNPQQPVTQVEYGRE